jgi:hypothetical protein
MIRRNGPFWIMESYAPHPMNRYFFMVENAMLPLRWRLVTQTFK